MDSHSLTVPNSPGGIDYDSAEAWAEEFLDLLRDGNGTSEPGGGGWPQRPISHRPWFIASVACTFVLVSAIALAGNVLFCVVIWRAQHLRTVTNVLMTHLGVANILFVTLHSPLFLSRYVYKTDWTMGTFLCKLCSSSEHITATASFYLMTCVAADRWLAVFFKTKRLSMTGAGALAALSWLVALAAASPYMLYFDLVTAAKPLYDMDALLKHLDSGEVLDFEPVMKRRQNDTDMGGWATRESAGPGGTAATPVPSYRCALRCENCEGTLLVAGVLIQYAIPLAVIIPSYGHLVCFLAKRPKSLGRAATRTRSDKSARRRRNTIFTLLAIVGSLITLWAPLYAVSILHRASLLPRDSLHLWIAAHLCASAAVTLTPVLYLTNGTFRTELYRFVTCMRPLAISAAHAFTEYSTVMRRRKSSPALQHITNNTIPSKGAAVVNGMRLQPDEFCRRTKSTALAPTLDTETAPLHTGHTLCGETAGVYRHYNAAPRQGDSCDSSPGASPRPGSGTAPR